MFLINGYEGLLGTAFLSPPPQKKKILQTIIVGDFNDFFFMALFGISLVCDGRD